MLVALQYLICPHRGILCSFCKPIKSHHLVVLGPEMFSKSYYSSLLYGAILFYVLWWLRLRYSRRLTQVLLCSDNISTTRLAVFVTGSLRVER